MLSHVFMIFGERANHIWKNGDREPRKGNFSSTKENKKVESHTDINNLFFNFFIFEYWKA